MIVEIQLLIYLICPECRQDINLLIYLWGEGANKNKNSCEFHEFSNYTNPDSVIFFLH